MKNRIFISGISSIAAQTEASVFNEAPNVYSDPIFEIVPFNHKEYIPTKSLRRLSKALKMSISGAIMALKDAEVTCPDAIITGTGQGCKQDTERFLESVIKQKELLLSPTAFIHSTHNTIGGQIALHLNSKAYNVTYSQNSVSLEWALLDAMMIFHEGKNSKNVLVGGVDEISETITGFMEFDHQLKKERISNLELFKSDSRGTITSEGAHFFNLTSENKSSLVELLDISIIATLEVENITNTVEEFLGKNRIASADIDLVILGKNGDVNFDHFYEALTTGILKKTQQLAYKHLVGEYNTVSGYALWLGCKIIELQTIPEILKVNSVTAGKIKYVLLYNQYQGEDHSLILIRKR